VQELASGKLLLDEPAPHVARLKISNPEKRGALDHEILDALAETVRGLDARCLLLTGDGKMFSAGYDIGNLSDAKFESNAKFAKLIDTRSAGALKFHVASLYPTLYRLERRGFIQGRWVEKAGTRRRRFYRLTAAGQKVLDDQRRSWNTFFAALNRVAGIGHA